MARPGRPERNRTARSFRQLRRFHRFINSDQVFGTQRSIASDWQMATMCALGDPLSKSSGREFDEYRRRSLSPASCVGLPVSSSPYATAPPPKSSRKPTSAQSVVTYFSKIARERLCTIQCGGVALPCTWQHSRYLGSGSARGASNTQSHVVLF